MEKAIFFEDVKHFPEGAEEAFRWLAENGIDGLQFDEKEIFTFGEEAMAAALQKAGLKASVIHYLPRLMAADPAVFEEAVAHSLRALALCKRMDCRRLMVVPLPRTDVKGKEDLPRAKAAMIEGIRRIQPEADRLGISLYFENFSTETLPYGTPEDAEDILAACPRACYCFDTGNYFCTRRDAVALFPRLAPKTVMLHAKCFQNSAEETSIRCDDGGYVRGVPFGEGGVDVAAVLRAVKNYPNIEIVTVEHNARLTREEIGRSIRILHQCLD